MSDHQHFQQAYAAGAAPPWDIGRPQPVMVEALRRGWVHGRVLDAGCGTGEHALFFAAAGYSVVGVDVAPEAIERAMAKSAARSQANPPLFLVADILARPEALGQRSFGTVIDMGFFHTLSDAERLTWRSLLATILLAGGNYVMACFSELVPGEAGPRRLSEAEIRATFPAAHGFSVGDLERGEILGNRGGSVVGIPAWLARIERAQDPRGRRS